MGLTIKGQCIPDVTGPVPGGRPTVPSEGALGVDGGVIGVCYSDRAHRTPRVSVTGGVPLHEWEWRPEHPHSMGGIISPPPLGDVTCLQALSPSAGGGNWGWGGLWGTEEEDGAAGLCLSDCVSATNAIVPVAAAGGRRRCTRLQCSGRAGCLGGPALRPDAARSESRGPSGLAMGEGVTSVGECDVSVCPSSGTHRGLTPGGVPGANLRPDPLCKG